MAKNESIDWGAGWVWPVAAARRADPAAFPWAVPVVTNEFARPAHLGVDILYRSASGRLLLTTSGPVVAARTGTVWSVGQTARGHSVVLDHGPPFATFYQHLSEVSVAKGQSVNAGDVIGQMGADPTDGEHIVHLHFAVWYGGGGDDASVDPAPMLRAARRV